jgi:hypothetical protein
MADDLDKKIQQALSAEDSELFGEGGEMGLFEMALGSFKGRLRGWLIYAVVMTFIFTVIMFVCIWKAYSAPDTDTRLLWLFGVMFSGAAVGMLKIWWLMQMDKHNVLREIKRVELQIAVLAKRMKG